MDDTKFNRNELEWRRYLNVVCRRGIADCASQCDEAVCYCKSTGSNQYGFNGCANNATDDTGVNELIPSTWSSEPELDAV